MAVHTAIPDGFATAVKQILPQPSLPPSELQQSWAGLAASDITPSFKRKHDWAGAAALL